MATAKVKRPKRWRGQTRHDAVKAGYRSGLEQGIAEDLKAKGIKFEYESRKIKYTKPVRGGVCGTCSGRAVVKQAIYTPDFALSSGVIVESKGRFTASDRAKLALIRSQHPETDIRILFAADNWTTALRRQRYSEWASKHGYPWAVGKVIPDDWLN